MVLDGSEVLTSLSGRFTSGNHCAGNWNVGARNVLDGCGEETYCSISCSRSDSHVSVLKSPSVSETDSVPIFRVLVIVW